MTAAATEPPPASHRARMRFRPDIEGLRGVAILLVVAYHAGASVLPGGFVGVDVFFVVSGYLITSLLLEERERTGAISLPAFYARRMARLLPAGLLVLACTLALSAALYPPASVAAVAGTARAATAFVSNVFFARQATDYFSEAAASPLLHTWSLSVEEQFYLAWPLVLVGLSLLAPARRASGWAALAVIAASLAACWWWTIAQRPVAFFGAPLRAWEFAAGALGAAAAPAAAALVGRARRVLDAAGWGGLAAILASAAAFDDRTPFPGYHAALPVIGTLLVLLAGSQPERGAVGRRLSAPALQWVGRHSYSWYLWHWPVLILGAMLLPRSTMLSSVALVLLALPLAIATRVWVEDPCRRWGRRSERPWRVIGVGAAGIVAMLAVTSGVQRVAHIEAEGPSQKQFAAARYDYGALYRDGCVTREAADSTVTACVHGDTAAPVTVALFGDSHAAHWHPAIERIARERGWRLLVLTKSACPSVSVGVHDVTLGRRFTECETWRRAALDTIRARRTALVILSNSTEYVSDGPRPEPRASVTAAQWEAGLRETLAAVTGAGAQPVVITDTPRATRNVPECLMLAAWRGGDTSRCDFDLDGAVHPAAQAAERRAAAAVAGTRFVELSDVLCPGGRCTTWDGAVVRYRNARHLTASAAGQLRPALAVEIPDVPGTM